MATRRPRQEGAPARRGGAGPGEAAGVGAARTPDPREDLARRQRAALRRGRAALESLAGALDELGAREDPRAAAALAELAQRLDGLAPTPPRACKEYRRALALARLGQMGMHPEDVLRFCACGECRGLREARGIPHPPAPRGVAD